MKRIHIVLIGILSCTYSVKAQFKLMRYDENYAALSDSTKTWYTSIKYIPLSEDHNRYLSLGGEIRQDLSVALHEDWGAFNVGSDVFMLQRYQVHGDLHIGTKVRVFGQLRSGLEFGRKTGPRGIDEDQLNVQNLFLDIVPYKSQTEFITVRLGRQELQYGSGRLIDVRDGPNLRLYFDGIKAAYTASKLSIDAFVMADAIVKPGVFDNTSTYKPNLWGVYATFLGFKERHVDAYYLGINRANVRFDEGIADEMRHTIGTRFWRTGNGFIYNFEVGYQFGSFGTGTISAAAISSEVGYRFAYAKGSPTFKLRSDYISGDHVRGDGRLNTLNAMYPNGGYFGMNPQVGPANLLSLHPTVSWNPHKKISLTLDATINWRNSLEDGVYGPNGALRLPSSGSRERYVGTAYMTTFSWFINEFLSYNTGVQYFSTGSFINDVIPTHKDGFFVGSVLWFRF